MLAINNFILERSRTHHIKTQQTMLLVSLLLSPFRFDMNTHTQSPPIWHAYFTSPEVQATGNLRTQRGLRDSVGQVSSECFRQWVHAPWRFWTWQGKSHMSLPGPSQPHWIRNSACGAWAFIPSDVLTHTPARTLQGRQSQNAGIRRGSMEWSLSCPFPRDEDRLACIACRKITCSQSNT